jgi:hypothetical protein
MIAVTGPVIPVGHGPRTMSCCLFGNVIVNWQSAAGGATTTTSGL